MKRVYPNVVFVTFDLWLPVRNVLPVRLIPGVVPVYLDSSDVVVSLSGVLLVCSGMGGSQKKPDGQKPPDSSTEPHFWDSFQHGGLLCSEEEVVWQRDLRCALSASRLAVPGR